MTREPRVVADLADAAAVHAVRDEIVQALGPLAASPLDEHATTRMRDALERAQSPAVRQALRRLSGPGESRPPRLAVPKMADGTRALYVQALAPASLLGDELSVVCAPEGAA